MEDGKQGKLLSNQLRHLATLPPLLPPPPLCSAPAELPGGLDRLRPLLLSLRQRLRGQQEQGQGEVQGQRERGGREKPGFAQPFMKARVATTLDKNQGCQVLGSPQALQYFTYSSCTTGKGKGDFLKKNLFRLQDQNLAMNAKNKCL